ncbi:MAG TPA: DeoR family transcriptional regulator [Euryarchaeota archaeon]|nr:DeoR family transcriptional regulator [Euryarchaeota archaeon]
MNWILSELKERGKIKAKEVQSFLSIHRDTAIEDLNKLIKQGKIVKRGRGRTGL